jgi:hypothetical protein
MSIFQVSAELENRLPLGKGESRFSGIGVSSYPNLNFKKVLNTLKFQYILSEGVT